MAFAAAAAASMQSLSLYIPNYDLYFFRSITCMWVCVSLRFVVLLRIFHHHMKFLFHILLSERMFIAICSVLACIYFTLSYLPAFVVELNGFNSINIWTQILSKRSREILECARRLTNSIYFRTYILHIVHEVTTNTWSIAIVHMNIQLFAT